ncbi:hypothetical protein Q3G72_016999 [Acer saccharum]|nr:hypothetical protein Q3G72_016999 [Acer saccharum]
MPKTPPQQSLDLHNAARAETGVHNLTWNATIAAYARNYVNRRNNDCILYFSGGPYNENLFTMSGKIYSSTAFSVWLSEKENYDPKNNTCIEALLPPSISPNPQVVRPNSDSLGKREKIILGASIIAGSTMIIVGLGITLLVLRRNKRRIERFDVPLGDEFLDGIGPKRYSYQESATATCNFKVKNKLGYGGSGQVYEGFLSDLNSFVVVKKISRNYGQGIKQFVAEIKFISQLRHRHTVNLIGWCHDRELIPVYEFLCNGSQDSHLFKEKSLLTWEVRNQAESLIIVGLWCAHPDPNLSLSIGQAMQGSKINIPPTKNNGTQIGGISLHRKEEAAGRRRTATMNDLDGIEVCRKKMNNSPTKLRDEPLTVATKLRDEQSLPEEDEQLVNESLWWRSPVALQNPATHR